ncbi:MAG: hypothetical protein K2O78_01415 [Muribaculaceae bacterium]|nr:hypothetical protein [Muribaculaceae bacterium]MDE7080303.1 hypothetical protein [Muribaculaceae bacterium]
MNIDPKALAEEAKAKASATGANLVDQAKDKVGGVVDQAKDKVGDVVDQVKDKAGDVTGSLKEKAADVIAKGADMLDGLADKLKG